MYLNEESLIMVNMELNFLNEYKRILPSAKPELTLGILLTFSSSIGQTYFISLFSGEIRNEFNLSHGIFGTFIQLQR